MTSIKMLVAGLAAAFAVSAQAEDIIRLGNLKFAHYGAVSYMKEVCPKYGIKVEERMFPKGPDIMPAIVAGEVDLAALASDGAISGRANGVPIYTVAGFAKGGARIVAGVDSGIKDIKGLKGKKVGVTRGGAHELLLYAELEKAGLTWSDKPGKDVQIVFLSFADLNQALVARQIDAMCQSEPQSSQAINKKFGVEVMKPYTTAMGEPYRLLVMTEKLYANKDLSQRVMKCFVESTATFNKDMKLAETYVRDKMFKGQITSDDFKDAMDNADYTYDVTLQHVDVTTGFMQKYGVGRMQKPPKATEWVKLDLLQKAKADLKVK
ncbi:ABC transporter substrate-binding protein [Laribacter hongkongensis]|uniref:ABC transporter substrate-binding protein n=1 Tax=Laribacter hongkongensis TaxID=168471 RepID=UPI001EFE0A08|nr:ABC transporter substrate-binding protein [Laribacter hongkongensis]MCG8999699.1 ABC transporter substrate-binding protein [Laribacter hongkongensis]MCG9004155.1 ABC transporter substrate-binding protein [Laribacter hongkongensis]MCG9013444.1 ABC transporter substrate-binding protein [Laribacter hongkongensis]MCG9019124.1 ABC transporter substrate-binding protein [Laribacter hongkongensis]MCG9027791.1 ABC transporter substrate-binding protein [Laribacter hongkongensis]